MGFRRARYELEDWALKYYNKSIIGDIHINTLKASYKEMEFENDMDVKMTVVYYTELAMMSKEKTMVLIFYYVL